MFLDYFNILKLKINFKKLKNYFNHFPYKKHVEKQRVPLFCCSKHPLTTKECKTCKHRRFGEHIGI
jgi:hypothetical protein